jgi:multipile epidermal growth factor-like domains protein 8
MQDECHLVEARAGKQLDLRLAGHSTVFHPASQTLVVYGGLAASHARAAALSDRMYTFHVS